MKHLFRHIRNPVKARKGRSKNRCAYMHVPTYRASKEDRDIINLIQALQ